MLNDLARLLSSEEPAKPRIDDKSADRLSNNDIDRILESAWENCLTDSEKAGQDTDRASGSSVIRTIQ